MNRIYKCLFCYVLTIFCITLTSCYKQEKYDFQEGKYQYEEDFYLYKDTLVTDLYLILSSTTDGIDESENLLINRKNNNKYNVDIVFTLDDNNIYKCKFKMCSEDGLVGDQVDRYYIELDVSNILNMENTKLLLVLEFAAPYNYENKVQPTIATEIYIHFKYFTFNDGTKKDTLCSSRVKLEFV